VDSEVIEGEALIVFILNAGSIGGVMGLEIPEIGDVDISDDYLDLYAITKGLKQLRAISKYLFHSENEQISVCIVGKLKRSLLRRLSSRMSGLMENWVAKRLSPPPSYHRPMRLLSRIRPNQRG